MQQGAPTATTRSKQCILLFDTMIDWSSELAKDNDEKHVEREIDGLRLAFARADSMT